ncbi:MAG TPA: LLM class flavin-dependent oxidoreductase, partial [Candidatus Limnocylindrales bacterium]
GQRLDWMDEAAAALRQLLDGGEVTSAPGAKYEFDHLRQEPLPIQQHLPLMIGGSGEKKTLRTIAKYADMWNGMGDLETMRHKMDVLLGHCADVGRDPNTIIKTTALKPVIRDSVAEAEKVWRAQMAHNKTSMSEVEDDVTFVNGPSELVAEHLIALKEIGFTEAIAEMAAPYDDETLERFIGEVKPLVDRA